MEEPANGELTEAIARGRAAFVAALNAGRSADAAMLYAEDARLLAPSAEVIEGRDAIEAFWRAGLQSGLAEIQLDQLELDPRDGVAYEIGRYTLRFAPSEGGPVVDRGNYLLVHRRQADGGWRRAIETFNPDGPSGARQPDQRRINAR
jgi:ketosteroid isomerase-like protein